MNKHDYGEWIRIADKQAEYKFYYRETLSVVLKYLIRNVDGRIKGSHLVEDVPCDMISIIRNLLEDKKCLDDGEDHSLFDDLVDFSDPPFTNEEKKLLQGHWKNCKTK